MSLTDAIKIDECPGRLPGFWNREVVFIANLLSLFFGNERETAVLRDEVGSIESYGGRLAPILNLLFNGPENLLVLEQSPDPALLDYFSRELGLALPRIEILPHADYLTRDPPSKPLRQALETIRRHPSEWIDGFVTDSLLEDTARLTGKKLVSQTEGSKRGNNKLLQYEHLKASGLPCFDTLIAEKPEDVPACLATLEKQGYRRAVIKAQIGASGIGMKQLDTGGAPPEAPAYLFHEGACLVQGWLDESVPGVVKVIGSPSVQIFVHDERLHLYDITAQFLNPQNVHEGNHAPAPFLEERPEIGNELLRQAGIAALWLHGIGYRGTASADFHIAERQGRVETRLCEINARVTGATYPSVLARRFIPEGAWLMRNVRFNARLGNTEILEILERAGVLYRPGKPRGILPINFNPDDSGAVSKAQLLALGQTRSDIESAIRTASEHPSLEWNHERD